MAKKKKRLDSGNNHEKNFRTTKGTIGRSHKTLDGIRLTELAHPYQIAYWMLFKKHANESTVYFYRI